MIPIQISLENNTIKVDKKWADIQNGDRILWISSHISQFVITFQDPDNNKYGESLISNKVQNGDESIITFTTPFQKIWDFNLQGKNVKIINYTIIPIDPAIFPLDPHLVIIEQ